MRVMMLLLLGCWSVVGQAQSTLDSLYTVDGFRRYVVHTPPGFSPSEQLPLVLNLHGVGSDPAQQEVYSGMNAVADTARFVVVYPSGVNNSWNLGLGTVDEYGYFTGLLDTLAITHGIDVERIYACGMSQGGYMSFVLACGVYDRIAAIATVAGGMALGLDLVCNPARPVPVMMIHGTADGIVPFNGGLQNIAVPAAIDFWVAHNACAAEPIVTPIPNVVNWDFCSAEREDHPNGELGSEVALIRVIDGGHTWPGSAIPIGVTNQDFSASAVIWRFFARHAITGALSIPRSPSDEVDATLLPSLFNDRIELTNSGAEALAVEVQDAAGRVVLRSTLGPQQASSYTTVEWSPGSYVWSLRSAAGSKAIRTVLAR